MLKPLAYFYLHDSENLWQLQVIPVGIGFDLPISHYLQTLQDAAEAYFYLGWSVIPLLGDRNASRPKAAAVTWAGYQHCRASLQEHQQWFGGGGFAGLGIVTGCVSHLVVLDFDSEAVFNRFKAQYPHLLETHTVQSAQRQLPHLYFHLPDQLHIASHKGQGIDLLSDGRYVVAPPTCINGNAYKISRGGMPRTLTAHDVQCIKTFLKAHQSKPLAQVVGARLPECEFHRKLIEADVQQVYRRLLDRFGRNDSLFRASLFARDSGWTVEATKKALVTLHSQQKGHNGHAKETIQQRQREAVKTIESAFSRPPKSLPPQVTYQQGHLSNSVREKLMQQKKTYVVRTLEGLYQSGMRSGQWFEADDALTRLDGLVGRDSVLKALKAGEGEVKFFKYTGKSQNSKNTGKAVSQKNSKNKIKKCFLIAGKNQEKPRGGRPRQVYRMPSNKELCKILGVKMTHSDVVERADLVSARKTRMALHRELVKRRSGSYSKYWLSSRLGICRRTVDVYTQLLPIHSRAMFIETAIHWKTIERLPLDEALRGAFLQTAGGKRYPALRPIACRLLAKREHLCLKQQTANFYWYEEETVWRIERKSALYDLEI